MPAVHPFPELLSIYHLKLLLYQSYFFLSATAQLNSDLKDALVTQYAELNGTGNNYFYVDRKQGYRLSSAILHVYDTGYIRVEAISQEVNNDNCYVLWTNNSYPQNEKIGCDLVWIKENFLWN